MLVMGYLIIVECKWIILIDRRGDFNFPPFPFRLPQELCAHSLGGDGQCDCGCRHGSFGARSLHNRRGDRLLRDHATLLGLSHAQQQCDAETVIAA